MKLLVLRIFATLLFNWLFFLRMENREDVESWQERVKHGESIKSRVSSL